MSDKKTWKVTLKNDRRTGEENVTWTFKECTKNRFQVMLGAMEKRGHFTKDDVKDGSVVISES